MQRKAVERARRILLLAVGVLVIGTIWTAQQMAGAGSGPGWLQLLFRSSSPAGGSRVGLVAGHLGSDAGAVCPDGLTEAEVNLRVTELAAARLQARGIQVEILEEFDRRLRGYRADALVSIHADSCTVPYSGFKVASYEWGSEASELLAACLWDGYEAETGLQRHPDTITLDMTRYHAFREVASSTAAAIIEIGFLDADRALLTEQPERAAAGIVAGVLCFLEPGE